ncbi:hypothetical protein [Candidatus Synechococcus spongiarum]|uniref:hypothetical protein n=1 Tax=Candidatus Synechococcus spongiarum TaxID=431041 RepID=UPI0004B14A56|nr:hypothetical protein [Candidatus Synechococcus spongiarum]
MRESQPFFFKVHGVAVGDRKVLGGHPLHDPSLPGPGGAETGEVLILDATASSLNGR